MNELESQDLMTEAISISGAPEGDFLRTDEIGPAFDALTQDDKLKLYAIEAIRRRGTEFGKGELLREAICRTLDGERNCPRGVPFMAFLAMTMKSIASHARKKERRNVAYADPPESAHPDGLCATRASSPEGEIMTASVLHDIYTHFENDAEATLVLMGWADGLRGKALRDATGLSQAALDYAAKRIRTGARKLFPDGWEL